MKTRERVYQAIVTHIDQHGISPTVREIQVATGLRSTSQVADQFKQLERDGRIIRNQWKSRGIEIPGTTATARSGALIAAMVVADAEPTRDGYMMVRQDLIERLWQWADRIGA